VPVLSDEPPEVGNDGGGDEGGEGGCGEGGGDGGGLGGGGATTMVTICVVCATVGFTDATVTEAPAEVRELVMTAGVMAAKVCALAATVFIVADSEVGTVILASTCYASRAHGLSSSTAATGSTGSTAAMARGDGGRGF
jgi:hypothetical protein